MANEITISLSMSASKGGASVNSVGATGPATASYDMTGTDMSSGTVNTSTTTASLSVGAVTGPYRLYLCNLSSTSGEDIRVGNANADPITSIVSTLNPGDECFLVVPSGTTIYVESASGTPALYYVAVEK
jgi:hypothetical protein